jgi:tRNA(fMet)-specific endonuclease VapC
VKYLLDTSVISDFVRGQWAVRERLLRTSPSELAVSALTVMEVEYGLARDPARAQRIRPVVEALLAQVAVIACGVEEARETGRIRAELARQGTPIGPFDSLIAGTALVRRLILVTSNNGEFSRVPRLLIEDWRDQQVHDQPAA